MYAVLTEIPYETGREQLSKRNPRLKSIRFSEVVENGKNATQETHLIPTRARGVRRQAQVALKRHAFHRACGLCAHLFAILR